MKNKNKNENENKMKNADKIIKKKGSKIIKNYSKLLENYQILSFSKRRSQLGIYLWGDRTIFYMAWVAGRWRHMVLQQLLWRELLADWNWRKNIIIVELKKKYNVMIVKLKKECNIMMATYVYWFLLILMTTQWASRKLKK